MIFGDNLTAQKKQQRATYKTHWAAIRAIMRRRTGRTSIQWIKAHDIDSDNALTDKLAGRHGPKRDNQTRSKGNKHEWVKKNQRPAVDDTEEISDQELKD
jgi:hypothetical protein